MNLLSNTVFLNWRMNCNDRESNYASMADGYRLAVKRLFNSLLDDNSTHDADAVIYPIIFCAHQCVELYLKSIIIVLSELKGHNPWSESIPKTHDLNKLIEDVNHRLDDKDEYLVRNQETEIFYKMLDLFEQLGVIDSDYHPDFARYPESVPNKRQPRTEYPFVTNEEFIYDIQELANLLNGGCQFVDGWYLLFANRLSSRRVHKANTVS